MLLDVSCCGLCLNLICIFLFVSAVSCEISFSYDLRLCVISGGSSRGAFVRATSCSLYFILPVSADERYPGVRGQRRPVCRSALEEH
jgi:hypothetical protein